VRVPPGSRVLINGDTDALMRLMCSVLGGWAARVRVVPGVSHSRSQHAHGSAAALAGDCDVLLKFTVPMLALADGPMARTWTWRAGCPMPPSLEAEIADLEIIHIGDGWVRAMGSFGGVTAGHDVLDLHRAAVRLLGETPAPVQLLDGIPCRSCEDMSSLALLEQPPPDPDQDAPPFCRCQSCRDEMTAVEYKKWTKDYAGWIGGSGILRCRRCDLGQCAESPTACQWDNCTCTHPRHAARAA
jgi:hypothetical protein